MSFQKSILEVADEEVITNEVNEINLKYWESYLTQIKLHSLWLFPEGRLKSGAHKEGSAYPGNFLPQIPRELMLRFTKTGDWVLDAFLGGGTTLIEAFRQKRNAVGIDLQKESITLTKRRLELEASKKKSSCCYFLINGDSTSPKTFEEVGDRKFQLVILHPPYWKLIKYGDDPKCLSNPKDLDAFLQMFGQVVSNSSSVMKNKGYLAVVIGDIRKGDDLVPLSCYCMNTVLKTDRNIHLKSIIIKDVSKDDGPYRNHRLRSALKNGRYLIAHEYIYLYRLEKA